MANHLEALVAPTGGMHAQGAHTAEVVCTVAGLMAV